MGLSLNNALNSSQHRMKPKSQFIKGRSLNDSVKVLRLLRQLDEKGAINSSSSSLRACEFFLAEMPTAAAAQKHFIEIIRGDAAPLPKPDAGFRRFYVLPRRGTCSPWSSKAGDILNDVLKPDDRPKNLERGVLYETNIRQSHMHFIQKQLCDEMTQEILEEAELEHYFADDSRQRDSLQIEARNLQALKQMNLERGLAFSGEEMLYLKNLYEALGRDATEAEIVVFAQLNSEHCRHKVFNALLNAPDGKKMTGLFEMIKRTSFNHPLAPKDIVSAYKDNAAIFSQRTNRCFDATASVYETKKKKQHLILKAETHNHPTFVSPYEGAATGVGGEIRDELACGRGGDTKGGFVGFAVSDLNLTEMRQPWEQDFGEARHKADSRQIMLQAPLGGNDYGNEFGRPSLGGFFRTLACEKDGVRYAYHKPIMLAGGWGEIHAEQAQKGGGQEEAMHIILLGAPALRIGLGGGAMSSAQSDGDRDLNFSSVQRDNAEMERRCAEVIVACSKLGEQNPILFVHDLGAGGLGNALAELLNDCDCGGVIDEEKIPVADKTMNAMEILANESQERFLLAVDSKKLKAFERICRRENAPYADIGRTDGSDKLCIKANGGMPAMDLAVSSLFPKQETAMEVAVPHAKDGKDGGEKKDVLPPKEDLKKLALSVLQLPAVASKSFLITIGDRSVGGLTFREQMIGPHQIPVSDYAATLADYRDYGGEACALGERMPVAVTDAAAASSLALGEVISNIAASGVEKISDIKLCANWMASVHTDGQLSELHKAVKCLTEELCMQLGMAIPVGKDSLFMRASIAKNQQRTETISPVSLVLAGLAPVKDLRLGRTPQLTANGDLWWLYPRRTRAVKLGGSALAQVTNCRPDTPPVLSAAEIKNFFNAVTSAIHKELVLAYHDLSDGGLWTTLCEMAFAGNCGLKINLDATLSDDIYRVLFGEELGAVMQISPENEAAVKQLMHKNQLDLIHLGSPCKEDNILVTRSDDIRLEDKMTRLRSHWGELSWQMSRLRDNPACADAEHKRLSNFKARGLFEEPVFDLRQKEKRVTVLRKVRPRVAVLRCQGTNGAREMAAAFDAAGFEATDIHMRDLKEPTNQTDLSGYKGVAFCGGFSYGDALEAGAGWSLLIMRNSRLRDLFAEFFERTDTFALGVCNGCQALARLDALIPGADWDCRFLLNRSQRYEARTVMARICDSPSIFLHDMAGSLLPVVSAHAEGRADFRNEQTAEQLLKKGKVAMTYADDDGKATMTYPLNPNGSAHAVAALTSASGRVTIMMPHPERVFKSLAQTWRHPADATSGATSDYSCWQTMFLNARLWVG